MLWFIKVRTIYKINTYNKGQYLHDYCYLICKHTKYIFLDDAFESLTTADIDYELANSVPEEFSLIRDFIISVMPL